MLVVKRIFDDVVDVALGAHQQLTLAKFARITLLMKQRRVSNNIEAKQEADSADQGLSGRTYTEWIRC